MANEWDEAPEQMDQALEDAPLDEGPLHVELLREQRGFKKR